MPLPDSRARSPHRAFSFIELVVVLAIIGTMAAVALPRYGRSVERYRAERAALRLAADLAYARSHARATSAPVTVRFDLAAGTCALLGVLDPGRAGYAYVTEIGREPYRAAITSAVFDAGAGDPPDEVVFDVYGIPDSDGVVVVAAGAATRTIVLDPDTGKADVP